ncbi:MAG: 5'-nucleotidase C-terminal domain-containing protein [Lachnospirales bacterium]
MSFKKKTVSSLLALTLAASTIVVPVYADETTEPELVVIFNNDTHGRTFGDPATAGLKDYYEAQGIPTLLLHAGDSVHGQSIASLTDGQAIVDIMNADDYDALVPGNHEFNYGLDRLIELSESATFPFLAANVSYKADDSLVFEPYTIFEEGDLSVGIFGLATPETLYKTNPSNVETVNITEPVPAAEKVVAELEEKDVDFIISLAHLGIDESTVLEERSTYLAEQVDGIDLVVDGHSHTFLEEGMTFDDTFLVQTGEYFNQIGLLKVYDIDTTPTYELEYIDPSFDEENPMPEIYEGYVPNEEVSTLVDKLNAETEAITSEVIGSTEYTLDGEREQVRVHETNLTSLLTNALIDASGADLALGNGGNTRASIEAGEITLGDVITTWPFGNMVVTIDITGQEFYDAIEHGIQHYPEANGGFPHIAGAKVEFDPNGEAGNRITSITNEDGTPFDLDKTYTLVTNEFLANAGDDYTMFEGKVIKEYFEIQSDVVIDYIQAGNEIPEFPAGRLVAVETSTEPTTPDVPDYQKPEVDPVPPTEVIVEPKLDTYVVVKGDTLSKIARQFNTTWKVLADVNDLSNPNLIYPGQELIIQ